MGKDLLDKLKEWQADFDKTSAHTNHVDYDKAKAKYILKRWNDYEKSGGKYETFKI